MPVADDFSRLVRTVRQNRRRASRNGLYLLVAVLIAGEAAAQGQCLHNSEYLRTARTEVIVRGASLSLRCR